MLRKFSCSILTVVIIALALCSCSSGKPREVQTVSEDDTWYDSIIFDIDDRYTTANCDYLDSEYLMFDDGKHYVMATGSDLDFNSICSVDIYDLYGEYIESYDIGSLIGEDKQIMSYCSSEGKIFIDIMSHSSNDSIAQCMTVDMLTGQTAINDIPTSFETELNNYDLIINDTFYIDNCHVRTLSSGWGESYVRYVEFEYEDGTSRMVSLEDTNDGRLAEINQIFEYDNRNIAVGRIYGEGQAFYDIDVVNGTFERITDEFEWINDSNIELYGSVQESNDRVMSFAGDIIDLEAHEITGKFLCSDSYINLNLTNFIYPVYADESLVICAGSIEFIQCNYGRSVFRIAVFDKADSNPNAGKKIITALNPNGVACDVIADYNLESEEYFVKSIFRAADEYATDAPDSGADIAEWRRYYLEAEEEMTRQIMSDIEAATSPDIIFSYDSMMQELSSGNYLEDLSREISGLGILGTGEYFDNAFDALRTGDKLYQIPLSLGLEGNIVRTDYLDDDQYGLTYDQYVYLYDECYNTRQKSYDKISDFVNNIVFQYDLFTEDGNIDFDNEAFRATAEYYNENVFRYGSNEFQYDESVAPMGVGHYDFVWHLKTLGRYRLIGNPSFDGRGATFSAYTAGISKGSPVKEEAWNIIRMMLTPDYQMLNMNDEYSNRSSDNIPVSIEAFEARAQLQLQSFNLDIAGNCGYFDLTESMMAMYGFDEPLGEQVISDFEQMVLHAGAPSYHVEAGIYMTLYEEIQAYFAGDRTIDEIIPIINDRCRTIHSEQG